VDVVKLSAPCGSQAVQHAFIEHFAAFRQQCVASYEGMRLGSNYMYGCPACVRIGSKAERFPSISGWGDSQLGVHASRWFVSLLWKANTSPSNSVLAQIQVEDRLLQDYEKKQG
jgi:hypothetical protein